MHQNYALDIVSLRFGSIKDEAIEYLPARGAATAVGSSSKPAGQAA
ncbi:hypothetical protein MTX26_33620 [Bradyrhizobium sp. ISRA443]|nr:MULTISPECIES: hypothetical protein [unclassified Bradyrhizobium]WGR99071.1 hypothetical protein MTX23_33600 [Bradyrhizobium sp. ISRA436]WGS05962.1 hypothetical protein MTX18_33620 [Bradyrhizobium sp. ISRA437]WGS12848.1 hypothetical protein MTX26_33620 [Bradyrhizobium sp. ISRA443]